MKYSYLYLDVAGTLLFKEGLYETMQSCIKEAGFSISKEEIQRRHKILSELVATPSYASKMFYNSFNAELLYSLGIIPKQELIDQLYIRCKNLCWEAYDDVSALKGIHIRIGIISNWDKTLEEKLHSLIPFPFQDVFGSGSIEINKPNENIFKNAFGKTGVPFEQIVYIGDSVKLDIEPAVLLGARAVLIDRENQYPWYVGPRIRTLSEVAQILHASYI